MFQTQFTSIFKDLITSNAYFTYSIFYDIHLLIPESVACLLDVFTDTSIYSLFKNRNKRQTLTSIRS